MNEAKNGPADPGSGDSSPESNWPTVIGNLGLGLGAVMILDVVDDALFRLFWAEEDWARWVGSNIADLIVAAMPPLAWQVLSTVIQIGLGALLVAGSLRLRRRRASAVGMCRTWAKLAIVWAFVVIVWGMWWIVTFGGEIPGVSRSQLLGGTIFGMAVAAVLLLAYPLFLLIWFSRDQIRSETATWLD